jgi:DNA-binding CsgD family transcriptional regulator
VVGAGKEKRTVIAQGSKPAVSTSGGDALDRRQRPHAVRFRWGATQLVLFSIPLEERPPASVAHSSCTDVLSPAEQIVTELAYRGYSNAEIAKRRATTIATTRKQLETAYRKLRVSSRSELVALLARRGRIGR